MSLNSKIQLHWTVSVFHPDYESYEYWKEKNLTAIGLHIGLIANILFKK